MDRAQMNVDFIRQQINEKIKCNNSVPFSAATKNVSKTVTDFDTFPYPRFFRGEYDNSKPIVMEREAGWRERHDSCYNCPERQFKIDRPQYCWQVPCSTTFPCTRPPPVAAAQTPCVYISP